MSFFSPSLLSRRIPVFSFFYSISIFYDFVRKQGVWVSLA